MKTKFVLASFIAALSGLAALATSAKADTDFNLRVNLGLPRPPVILVSDRDHDRNHNRDRDYERDRDYREHSAPRGFWKEIVVKTWIPARWFVSCDYRGREVRSYERGHLECRTDRVWVEYGRDHDRDGYARR